MQFSSVEVAKTKDNYHFVEWDLSPVGISDPESIDDYKFQIHWSNDPISGFAAITDSQGDPVEIDGAIGPLSYTHQLKQYEFNLDYYYKILAIKKVPPGQFFSNTVVIGMSNDGIHEVMRYNEDLLYQHYYGEPCAIRKRKSFGARCPTCWSPTRQQRLITHCDTCHGTGFVSGYYHSINIQLAFDSNPKKSDSQKEWENVFTTLRARLSNYPRVRPKDLIINKDDYRRFVVTHVELTKLPRLSQDAVRLSGDNYILSQLLVLEELNPDDNEYAIPADSSESSSPSSSSSSSPSSSPSSSSSSSASLSPSSSSSSSASASPSL